MFLASINMRRLTAILVCFAVALSVVYGEVSGECPVQVAVVQPRNDTFGLCVDQCQDDANCTLPTHRCCFTGCGHVCYDVTTPSQSPCPEVHCTIACAYGYQEDINGCAMCACINQTVIHDGDCPMMDSNTQGLCIEACQHDGSCSQTQKCCSNGCGHQCLEAVQSGNSIKSGQCPVSVDGGIGLCIEDCIVDTDCTGNLKCCSNGCGHQCMEPFTERAGTCPIGLLPEGSMGICQELCTHDNQCPPSHRCCSNGCGHACMLPVDLPAIHAGTCPVPEDTSFGSCQESCVNDGNCSTNQKCCSNGCGHICMDAVKECPSVLCMMWCPHGYQQDSNGCDICQCNVPTVIHAGDCPVVGEGDIGVCSELCHHDGNCIASQKCCTNGCGHTCMEAINHEPTGSFAGCPEVTLDQVGVCIDECSTQVDCNSTQLCCPNGCGHQCMDSINVHPGSCPVGDLALGSSGICADLCNTDKDCPSSQHKCCSNGCGHVCLIVTPTPDECPAIACRMFCLFGFKKNDNGCDICECYESQVIHPGMCPVGVLPQDMIGSCVEGCHGDEDCANHEKCCSNGCGHTCLNATAISCPDFMCAIYCEYGYQRDQNGCNACICLEAPEDCEEVFCRMHCPYGYRKQVNGCPYCECQEPPPVECPSIRCMMWCPYGFQRDANGCEMCLCNQQTEVHMGLCPPVASDGFGICSESCEHDGVCADSEKCCPNNCGGHQCTPAITLEEKPGTCPDVSSDGSMGVCIDGCSVDFNCTGSKKCCDNGCGHQCMEAMNMPVVRPGICPIGLLGEGMNAICSNMCQEDMDCAENQKCCSNGCGQVCMTVVQAPDDCDVMQCMMFCPYGFQRDAFGCEMCVCNDLPGSCPTGVLPEGLSVGVCLELCQGDHDCNSDEKCCSNGCGHQCLKVVNAPVCPDAICLMFCPYGFQKDDAGCDMCACNVQPVACPPVMCNMYCDYGFNKDATTGCDLCSCHQPATHDGKCPAAETMIGLCGEFCTDDGDCSANQKCCSNGCGHTCVEAVQDAVVKPGICPTVREDRIGTCIKNCSTDGDCTKELKCCSNGCGHICLEPAKDEPVMKPGLCPAVTHDSPSVCADECLLDADCKHSFKCCQQGCGYKCIKPVQIEDLFGNSGANSVSMMTSMFAILMSIMAMITLM